MTNDQTVTQALEPCPFCGGESVNPTYDDEFEAWRCGCSVCNGHTRADTEAEAIAAWNTRTAHSGEGRSNGAGEDTIHREREAAAEIGALRKRVGEANETIIAFAGLLAASYAREHELPSGHLHPTHYDILEQAGARMDSFTRAALAQPEAGGEHE